MNCKVCKQPLTDAFFTVVIDENNKTHLDCFFDESIPNVPSESNPNYVHLDEIRKNALEKRGDFIRNLK